MSQQRLTVLIEAINRSRQGFTEAETDLKRLRDARTELNRSVLEESRGYRTLNQAYRLQNRDAYEAIGLMRSIGSIGTQLISIYQSQAIQQINVRDAAKDVADAQRAVNDATEMFGTDSVQYAKALEDLETAHTGYKTAVDNSATATTALGLAVLGVIGNIGLLILKIGETITIGGALATLLTALGPGLGLAAIPLIPDIISGGTGVPQSVAELPKEWLDTYVASGGVLGPNTRAEDVYRVWRQAQAEMLTGEQDEQERAALAGKNRTETGLASSGAVTDVVRSSTTASGRPIEYHIQIGEINTQSSIDEIESYIDRLARQGALVNP